MSMTTLVGYSKRPPPASQPKARSRNVGSIRFLISSKLFSSIKLLPPHFFVENPQYFAALTDLSVIVVQLAQTCPSYPVDELAPHVPSLVQLVTVSRLRCIFYSFRDFNRLDSFVEHAVEQYDRQHRDCANCTPPERKSVGSTLRLLRLVVQLPS